MAQVTYELDEEYMDIYYPQGRYPHGQELRGEDLLEAARRWPDLLEEDYRRAPDI